MYCDGCGEEFDDLDSDDLCQGCAYKEAERLQAKAEYDADNKRDQMRDEGDL